MRLEHANITVSDIDRSQQFYRELFDLDLRWDGSARESDGPVRAVHLGNEHSYLALFEATKAGRAPADYDKPGLNHIAFEVDDVEVYQRRLEHMGVPIHLEGDYEPGRRIYCYDPDGVELELVSY